MLATETRERGIFAESDVLMQTPKSRTSSADALVGLWTLALTAFVIGALYFARELLIPLALSALLTFLLSPVVARVERWIGRIAGVLVIALLIFTVVGGAGWLVTRQLVDLATKLPEYKGNITTKLHAFRTPKNGAFTKFSQTVDELKEELPGGTAANTLTITQEVGKPQTAIASPPNPPTQAVPVKVVETAKANPIELVRTIITPLLGPLGTAALVLVLVICMLFQREELRNRLIRLVGQGRISATTRALDDAADRVSSYLRMQLLVNVTYGICIGTGLYFIGVPNYALWGSLSIILRFIPYIGPWVATILPTGLALAVSPGWTKPILTVALFGGIELILNNVLEPLLYGRHTGVSSIALIVAAVFWTWLWGPLGLVLATPLTVCLVVMGRHVPRLAFLSILLSDEEALTPGEDFYHRLITAGDQDEGEFVDSYLKDKPVFELYDSVFLPVIRNSEKDAREGRLESDQLMEVRHSLRAVLDDLSSRPTILESLPNGTEPATPVPAAASDYRVCCLPARAERDELAGAMLAHLLTPFCHAQNASVRLESAELLDLVEKQDAELACISVVAPSTLIQARHLCAKLRSRYPQLKIVVGLWGATDRVPEASARLRESGADAVVTSFTDAVAQISALAQPVDEPMIAGATPADEDERLAALADAKISDEYELVFDRITAKVARLFEVPIALLNIIESDRQFFKSHSGLAEDLAKARHLSRDVSVCSHVVAGNDVVVVEDLARDRRFANNPLLKDRKLRFYAGAPIRAANNQPIGSLCILDFKPRRLTPSEVRLLQEYASEVSEEIARKASLPSPVESQTPELVS